MRDHLVPPVLDTRGHPHLALPSSERHRDLLLPRRHLQHDPQLGRPFLQHCALLFLLLYSCRITLEEVILYILASRFGSNGDALLQPSIEIVAHFICQFLLVISSILLLHVCCVRYRSHPLRSPPLCCTRGLTSPTSCMWGLNSSSQ